MPDIGFFSGKKRRKLGETYKNIDHVIVDSRNISSYYFYIFNIIDIIKSSHTYENIMQFVLFFYTVTAQSIC